MDAFTVSTFLSPILNVTTVWNTGETDDIYAEHEDGIYKYQNILLKASIVLFAFYTKILNDNLEYSSFSG